MAGEVAKIRAQTGQFGTPRAMAMGQSIDVQLVDVNGQVTQKPFDDFHLYDLNRTVSVRDGETKSTGCRPGNW